MIQKAPKPPKILKVKLSGTNRTKVLADVLASLNRRRHFFITTPNPEIIVQAQSNPGLLAALNQADLALPDGIGLILAAKFLGLTKLNRLRGRDMMIGLLDLANSHKLKVFLLGSTPKVNQLSIIRIIDNYPHLQVRGFSGPKLDENALPVSKADIKKQKDILDKINHFSPDFLFVAFGAPKQELWLAKYLPRLNVKIAMTVGGSFDYYAGAQPLPPKYLASLGLEWLWRLVCNPARAKRIFNAVIIFPLLVIKQKLTK